MAYYMCPKCFNAYDSLRLKIQDEVYYCPNLSCNDEELFNIDELMIDPIQILNMKGYRTRFCCSGHTFSKPLHSYIMFDRIYDFNTSPKSWKVYNTKTFSLNEEYSEDYIPIFESVTMVEVTQDDEGLNLEEKRKIISERIADLLRWVINLPKYEEDDI